MVINKVRGLLFTTPTMLGPPSIPVLPYHLYRIVVIEWFWTRIQLVQIRTKGKDKFGTDMGQRGALHWGKVGLNLKGLLNKFENRDRCWNKCFDIWGYVRGQV